MGQIVALTIGGSLFLQIVQLTNTYHEIRQVEKCIPEKQISKDDFQYFIYLKNGKKFELRYGKSKSEIFEGFYFKHPQFNNGKYIAIIGIDTIKGIKNFLRLNLTQSKEQNKPIFRFGARKTRLFKVHYCYRCGGSGYIKQFKHVMNGVCFACNIDGHKPAPEGWNKSNLPVQMELNLENS